MGEEDGSSTTTVGSSRSSFLELVIQLRKLLASVEELEGVGDAEAKQQQQQQDRERRTRRRAKGRAMASRRRRRWLDKRTIVTSAVESQDFFPLSIVSLRVEKGSTEKAWKMQRR